MHASVAARRAAAREPGARRRKEPPRLRRETGEASLYAARLKLLEMRQLAAEAGPAEPDAVPTARRARRAGPPSAAAMHASVAKQRQQISWEILNADQVPAPFAAPSGLDKRMATLHPTIRAGGDQFDLARHLNKQLTLPQGGLPPPS